MSERIGVCGGCGARFRIPETFTGSSAKCKKCGGVITIGEADAAAPPAAPSAPAPRAAAAPPRVAPSAARPAAAPPRAERTGARRGAREGDPGAARHGRRGHAAEKKGNPALLVGAVAGVLVVGGGIGFFLLGRGDADEGSASARTPDHAAAPAGSGSESAAPVPVAATVPTEPGAAPTPADTPGPVETAPTDGGGSAAPADPSGESAAKPAADEGADEPLRSKFEFDVIERAPGTTDDEWKQMEELGERLKESGKARKRAMDKLLPFGIKAVPILVKSLNGLDLTDGQRWVDGFEVAKFIQDDLTCETILIPYHGDYSTDPKDVNRNHKVLMSIVDYWNTQTRDPVRWEMLLKKYEEKKANKGRGGGDE